MRIYVVNESTVLQDAQVESWLPALHTFGGHVASAWHLTNPSLVFGRPPDPEEWQIVLLDDSDQAGALGYHDYSPGGRPISKIFAKTDLHYGASVTVTITHELAEMLVDAWIVAAWQTSNTRLYALEVGDPVEEDALGYHIVGSNGVGVLVSDFALPAWFIPGCPPPYDHAKHVSRPLQVLPGGYAQYFENGQWNQVNEHGERVGPGERADRFRPRG